MRSPLPDRGDILERIDDYLSNANRRPLILHGVSGSGKTAVVAKAYLQPVDDNGSQPVAPICDQGPVVIARFLETTPASSDLRTLLISLNRELGEQFGNTADLPSELNELSQELQTRLGQACSLPTPAPRRATHVESQGTSIRMGRGSCAQNLTHRQT